MKLTANELKEMIQEIASKELNETIYDAGYKKSIHADKFKSYPKTVQNKIAKDRSKLAQKSYDERHPIITKNKQKLKTKSPVKEASYYDKRSIYKGYNKLEQKVLKHLQYVLKQCFDLMIMDIETGGVENPKSLIDDMYRTLFVIQQVEDKNFKKALTIARKNDTALYEKFPIVEMEKLAAIT